MDYLKKELMTTEIKLLRDALLECRSIRDYTDRQFIIRELNKQYPSIELVSKDTDLSTYILRLITICQRYHGALEHLIKLIELIEGDSLGSIKLKMTIEEIFSPPKLPSLIKKENSWVIRVNQTGDVINIPFLFSPIDRDELEIELLYMRRMRRWKFIHTHCEILIRNFMIVYKYIWSERVDLVSKSLKYFREECNEFYDELRRLNISEPRIFTYEPIKCLKFIPYCIDPLLDTMSYPPKSPYFILGQEFSHWIIDVLFEALRLADRILQAYFDQEQFD